MATLKSVIKKLETIRSRLVDIRPFYKAHRRAWTDDARTVATQVLMANPPPEIDPIRWRASVDATLDTIASQLLSLRTTGIVLFMGEREGRINTLAPALGSPVLGRLSLAEIAAYVAAGRAGDPLGKADFTTDDAQKEDWQIALNIQRNLSADRAEAIAAFLALRDNQHIATLIPAVLEAWLTWFSIRATDDWKTWVRQQIQS